MFKYFSKIGPSNFIYSTGEIENSLLQLILKDLAYFFTTLLLLGVSISYVAIANPQHWKIVFLPMLMSLFFVYKVGTNYCLARSGNYTVFTGTCVESPKDEAFVNKFRRRIKRDTKFLMETDDGQSIYIRARGYAVLPRVDSQVTVIVSNFTKVLEDGNAWKIYSYLTLKTIMRRNNRQKKKIDF